MNNVAAPAIGVEIAPPGANVDEIAGELSDAGGTGHRRRGACGTAKIAGGEPVSRRIALMLTVLLLVAAGMGIYAWRLHKKVRQKRKGWQRNSRTSLRLPTV